ncbi:class I SAM-dependent methyltransferase [Gordonia sp. (in: high G+C Gram-positive bacteria)]|uniref:class I SAM-dependent methyltransferase n=1 Tax=Gordonia sp. (in: high G+C Gram-positive bacteria) TaxID=84139 RepID=UPI001D256F34|nr:class I SAM-dependent methyltransferase [Gordonia sp. (in: high G+C Gram-positive bacteria)]MCB1295213.1 class I SAM-dependent methyltransferase [Gordonia sp. (in: high G+C Gram-positive bacteria)]HMS73680.1 class I SAM-dependent methyltransferase [Gordonia sp. (in: high G+C Gram-positive bacteria)]
MNDRREPPRPFGGTVDALRRLNSRHPWNHNDAFHPWILTRLPAAHGLAIDVGCGRGELLALLAERFDRVQGVDIDADMRRVSSARCAGLPNATVTLSDLADLPTGADLVTMIAVLHHMDLRSTLEQVARILNPGGRFLCVGLARPESVTDRMWDAASMITNPIIGFVRHPWPSTAPAWPPPFPVRDPELTFAEIDAGTRSIMPGAKLQHHLGFRHTIAWTKPTATIA